MSGSTSRPVARAGHIPTGNQGIVDVLAPDRYFSISWTSSTPFVQNVSIRSLNPVAPILRPSLVLEITTILLEPVSKGSRR